LLIPVPRLLASHLEVLGKWGARLFDDFSSGTPPRFLVGETLYSWVVRGLVQNKLRSPHLFRAEINLAFNVDDTRYAGTIQSWPLPAYADVEFDSGSKLGALISSLYGVDEKVLFSFFSASQPNLINIHFRHAYCSACIVRSMADYGFPVWRKDWCYTTNSYCVEHQKLFSKVRYLQFPDRRIWDAYIHSVRERKIEDSLFDRRLAGIILRVQKWINALEVAHPFTKGVQALYGVLLAKRTSFAAGGIAAAGFHQAQPPLLKENLNLDQRIELGLNDSEPSQRMGALLLIGWLIGIVCSSEIDYLSRFDYKIRRTLPSRPEQFARLLISTLEMDEVSAVRHKLSTLRDTPFNRVSIFLTSLNASTSSPLNAAKRKR